MSIQFGVTTPPTTPCSSSSPSVPSANTRSRSKSDDYHYKFTPPISKRALPRAWERKPATPFAPRIDSHKIWKRCEKLLGTWGYSREAYTKSEQRRSVKRIRVDSQRDNEMGFVATRYENFRESGRRKAWCAVELDEGICLVADDEMSAEDVMAAIQNATLSSSTPDTERENTAAATKPRTITDAGAAEEDSNVFQTGCDVPTFTRPNRPHHAQIMSDSRRIDAMIDKLASPVSFRRVGPKSTTTAVKENVAGVEPKTGTDEEQRPRNMTEAPHGGDIQMTISSCETTISPNKNSTMFETDDTEYLHAFITRANATKAARAMVAPQNQEIAKTPSLAAPSPRTRSRTALTTLDKNFSSSRVTGEVGILEHKAEQDTFTSPYLGENSQLRKSSRTRPPRPPRPQQNQPPIPCTIHFRRSNGTEFIFLQKTDAQHLAIATRSNTRRNRGEGLGPKMKLEALSIQMQPSPTKTERKRNNGKQVSWDEGLAYFAPETVQPTTDTCDEQLGHKPPLKRSRRLARARGTPAPQRKMAEKSQDIETPTAKKGTRTSSKGIK